MSPEHRTASPLAPRGRGRFKKIGGVASAALMVAVGLATPAAAIARGTTTHAGVAYDDRCDKNGRGKNCKPKPPPTPPRGCFDIDSTVQGRDKFISVVCNGRVFVLTVRETPPSGPPAPVGGWQFVGGPTDVIDATLATRDNVIYVSVLTARGTVQQGICRASEPLGSCTFYPLPTPPG
ncbi:hypothetical protein ACFOZ0_30830 [Streptomyces yaanensis]|uniref:Uncharacterized protein n=1 Tax=Streptomyces yaanensis TaxID=1142239 RepID=A0ABV7SMM1_9ACTN|nr:hypothetical protein [Streptomyces sp. CGMCC 4.7035]WNC01875.1 hypothetical protein Q2K21_29550 [Streptomyces sp. CGMCC 4.7035]